MQGVDGWKKKLAIYLIITDFKQNRIQNLRTRNIKCAHNKNGFIYKGKSNELHIDKKHILEDPINPLTNSTSPNCSSVNIVHEFDW